MFTITFAHYGLLLQICCIKGLEENSVESLRFERRGSSLKVLDVRVEVIKSTVLQVQSILPCLQQNQ